jgi:hypothetical protein
LLNLYAASWFAPPAQKLRVFRFNKRPSFLPAAIELAAIPEPPIEASPSTKLRKNLADNCWHDLAQQTAGATLQRVDTRYGPFIHY